MNAGSGQTDLPVRSSEHEHGVRARKLQSSFDGEEEEMAKLSSCR